MASYTLDDIRAAADRKYGSTFIEGSKNTVELVNPLRLEKKKRDVLTGIQGRLDEGEDQQDLLEEALVTASKVKAHGQALVKEIGGDLAVLAQLFEDYTKETEAGEA